jgi:Zn-dependent M28 family amino/carboxypeptidase
MQISLSSVILGPLLLLAGCASSLPSTPAAATDPLPTIGTAAMLDHIKILASDAFEGRAPSSKGEELTVAYITEQFRTLGLAPGNPDGSYLQRVPLMGTLAKPSLVFSAGGNAIPMRAQNDFVTQSALREPETVIDKSDLIFVGYGVVAPEYGWDDYKGMDLHGKTLVMLINDPPIPSKGNPAVLDPAMFGGKAMTYYGRWTYKYEMAAKLGAAAAIIVHETQPAGYPFAVLGNGWSQEKLSIRSSGVDPDFPPVSSWITVDRAKELFAATGKNFDVLKAAALSKNFRPVPLGATASFKVQNTQRDVESNNIIGRIEGSDPVLKNEYIIYSAHWDHLGIDEKLPGERTHKIYHGAVDNASGVASMLEIARAYKALPVAPKRTILFIATTAEEQNLLGARYYALHPLYPLEKTLVDINIDGVNPYGRTSDVSIVGAGKSSTDDVVARVAQRQGRTVSDELFPENGFFYRNDQFEFAKVGVPSARPTAGSSFIGKPPGFGRAKRGDYIAHAYHKVDDVVQPDWDLSGAAEDAQLLFGVGYEIAQGTVYPAWRSTAEFKRATPSR